jgi:hypothetical protein
MTQTELPEEFLRFCQKVTAKRPRTVIDHILAHGHITTEELKNLYGYNHPPRAARDVREQGIPLETFKVTGSDGRRIAAYRFADPSKTRRLSGRTAISKAFKQELVKRYGARCAIYLAEFDEQQLQVDHRIPFEIAGDVTSAERDQDDYMLLSGSANRAKSWSCEHCVNWREIRSADICRSCYWAFPERYNHVAMSPIRQVDIVWQGEEVADYERLRTQAKELQKDIPDFVREIIKEHLEG